MHAKKKKTLGATLVCECFAIFDTQLSKQIDHLDYVIGYQMNFLNTQRRSSCASAAWAIDLI